MSSRINHSGIVESVSADCVIVRITQTSACASCKVASYCNSSESKEKIVEVRGMRSASAYKPGDKVNVTASRSVAAKALLLGFGGPFVVMLCVLLITLYVTESETVAALAAIIALVPYFIVLFLLRNRVGRSIVFSITKEDAPFGESGDFSKN